MIADLYLFRAAMKDLLLPRKLWIAAALALLPAVIALIWRAGSSDFPAGVAYNILAGDLIFGFVLVILTVVYATGVVAQETEQKTIVYLLTRPIPRWRVLLVKFAAALLVALVTVWVASLLLALASFGPSGLGRSHLGHDCLVLIVGVLGYGALFLFLAVAMKRPLLVGILFAFGWESWVPNLPGSFQKVSLMAYLRVLAPHPKPESEMVDLSSLLTAANPETISHALAWKVLAGVTVAALAASFYLFSTREFAPRDDAE